MVGIITDSTCDIPEALIEQHGIHVVHHTIIWGDSQYRDRIEMQPEEFYRRLAVDPHHPTTSQAGIPDFQQAYETVARQGAKEIIVLTLSSAMSGAYQMALNAAKLVKLPVHVVDSKSATMGLGWQVLAAARACAAGADVQGILETIDQVRKKLVLLISMDTLEYLQRGGRIGGAVKWVGGMLNVKPLILVNQQTGLVEPVSLAHTQKAVVEMLYNRFFSKLAGGKNLHISVLHGNAKEKAEELAERIRTEFHPVELLTNITGPVQASNTGPGALSLCGYAED
ncbi:MAG TPA: DegV family protein [Anaerolineaceae bacterium]|nr:DegV family protein [Anaerolineaceae bacterium]